MPKIITIGMKKSRFTQTEDIGRASRGWFVII